MCFSDQAESVDDAFQFRGPKKPCLKECVLIINTETGEAILEKISNTMQLKAIRYTFKGIARHHMMSSTVTDLFPTGMAENHEIVLFPPLPTLPTCSPRLHQQSPNLLSPRHLLEKQPLTTAKDERNRQSQEPKFPRLGREPRPHNKSLVPKKVETEIQINLPLTPQPVADR